MAGADPVGAVVHEVSMLEDQALARWFVRHSRSAAPSLRLFLFGHAGAGPSVFAGWPAKLPPEVEVLVLQAPGQGARRREPLITRMTDLVDGLATAIDPYLYDVPYAFFGHSLGALVSFELSRRLRREGSPMPARAILASQSAPQLPALGARLHDQPDAALLEELRRKNGTPREFLEQPDLVPRLLPAVRAGYALLETYEHTAEPALPCALSAILGTDDPDLRTEHLEAWSIHTEKSFRLHHFPGDHFFHQDAPEALLALILEDVAAAAAALE